MIEYTLEVYGVTWEGATAVQSYSLSEPLKRDDEARCAAGDFQRLFDWRLVECRTSYEKPKRGFLRRIDEYRTLRGFRNGMRPQRFYQLANR